MPARKETEIFDPADANGSGLPHDPKLPDLKLALDAEHMARRFENHFRSSGIAADWAVSGCTIEKVYYKPSRHCGVCYRVAFHSASGGVADEWVYGRMFAPEIGQERFENASASTERPRPAGDCLADVPALGF